jgi:hypothetical protein
MKPLFMAACFIVPAEPRKIRQEIPLRLAAGWSMSGYCAAVGFPEVRNT